MIRLSLLSALATAPLCAATSTPTTATPVEVTPDPVSEPADAATDEVSASASATVATGEPVELALPLFFGGTKELSDLRGRVVVLAMGHTLEGGIHAAAGELERMQAAFAGKVRVAVVATDPTNEKFAAAWDNKPPPFILSWDPQGAVALRLGAATLPAVFVFDASGVLIGSVSALDAAALERVETWVRAAVG